MRFGRCGGRMSKVLCEAAQAFFHLVRILSHISFGVWGARVSVRILRN